MTSQGFEKVGDLYIQVYDLHWTCTPDRENHSPTTDLREGSRELLSLASTAVMQV